MHWMYVHGDEEKKSDTRARHSLCIVDAGEMATKYVAISETADGSKATWSERLLESYQLRNLQYEKSFIQRIYD
jgi:hypothetical protein